MRYRVPRNIVCTSFCSCAIGGMYIFSITFSLLFLSLTQTHEQTLFRAHTYTHIHTHTLYISIYISNSICFYFSFYHSYSLSLFLLLPFIFLLFIYVSPFYSFRRCVSYDFVSRTIFQSLYFDAFVLSFFFSFRFLFCYFCSPLLFFRYYTDNERRTDRLPIKQQTKYPSLYYVSAVKYPSSFRSIRIYSFRENTACTCTHPVHLLSRFFVPFGQTTQIRPRISNDAFVSF